MRPLLSLLVLVWLPSCVHVFTTHYDYRSSAPAPTAGGSAFRVEFIPKAKESGVALSAMIVGGALASEVGPYQMRLHAFGQPGDQQWFEIKSLSLSGKDCFNAVMESRGFTGRAEFQPTQTPGSTRASLLLGPYVSLDAKKQHDIVLNAEVVVSRRSGLARGSLPIPLALTKTKRRESNNVIAEIAHDIRDRDKSTIPAALPPPPESP